jgi:hypothetical protein
LGEKAMDHLKALNWIYWNIYIWVAILAIHALFVFGNVFFCKKMGKASNRAIYQRGKRKE